MIATESGDKSERRLARWGIIALLVVFVSVAMAYSIVNPLHEATDELRHYRFARIIATTGRLPVQGEEPCRSQSHHPPLYYALAALVTFWIDTGRDICYTPPSNPFWDYHYWEVGRDNKNQYLHGPDEAFPWHGEALAAHIMRALNVLIGAGVVWITWATARVIWPRRSAMALGAAAFVAFNPMFLYMSGAINNDVIAAFSGAAVVYGSARLLAEPRKLNWRWGLVFGALYGLALMSKFNLAPVIVLMAGAALWAALQASKRSREEAGQAAAPARSLWAGVLRLWLPLMAVTAVVAAIIAGWWFLRNQLLYGEPTGIQELTELWGVRNPLESFGLAISELPYAWTTLWGRFGFGQIPLPSGIYDGLKVIVGAGLVGAIAGFFRAESHFRVTRRSGGWEVSQGSRPMLVLLAANVVLFFAVLFNYMLVSPAGPNGRFAFPALSSLAVLTFYGLGWWATTLRSVVARRRQPGTRSDVAGGRVIAILALAATACMLALSLVALVKYLAPAYARPAALAEDAVIPHPVNARFDTLVTLLGYDVDSDSVQPGQALDLSLYWQVEAQPPGDYLLFVHLLDGAGTMVAQRDTHPGLGNFPSSLWRPGDRFVERIQVPIPETAYAPETGTLSIGLYAPGSYRLAVSSASGAPLGDSLALAEVAIEPGDGDLPNPQAQDFGHDLLLTGYEYDRRVLSAGDELAVTLRWSALREIEGEQVVRLRLLDAAGNEVTADEHSVGASDSSEPIWPEGLVVTDTHRLILPGYLLPGRYSVDLVVKDAASGAPVYILAEDGHQVNSHLLLAEVRVAN
jgi:hypothetical protein